MRFVGLDVHRDFCEVAMAEGGAVRCVGRIATTPAELERFAQGLIATDDVTLENTGIAASIVRILEPHVARVAVANVATVAVARKLAVLCWHLLTKGQDYAFARPSLVRTKLCRMKLQAGRPAGRRASSGSRLFSPRALEAGARRWAACRGSLSPSGGRPNFIKQNGCWRRHRRAHLVRSRGQARRRCCRHLTFIRSSCAHRSGEHAVAETSAPASALSPRLVELLKVVSPKSDSTISECGDDKRTLDARAAAADLLGVSPSTVRRWAADGRIACQRTPSGQRRFLADDLERAPARV